MRPFNTCLAYAFLCVSVLLTNVNGQCPWQDDTLPTVANGYRKSVDSLKLFSDGLAYGFYDIDCNAGFRLDATIGGRITCLDSGLWSQPLPSCISMGSCVVRDLFTFIETSQGIRSDPAKSFVFTNGVDDSRALGGSNVTLDCQTDFVNVGGSLTIVCTESDTWTTFPQCVSTVTATTPAADAVDTSVRCPVTNDTWIFPNGYMSNTSGLLLYSDNTAKGQATVSCSAGYAMDAISGGLFACQNGTWTSRPSCTKTARCSLPALRAFLNDTSRSQGLGIASQSLSTDANESAEILIGSSITFMCHTGYTNTDENLNVVCNVDGQWSSFPTCNRDASAQPAGNATA